MGDMTTLSPADLMQDYVVAYLNGIDPTFLTGWVWTTGKQTSDPDQLITFIDQGGPAAFPHLLADWPGLQLLVRGASGGNGYNVSWLQIRRIRDAILGMPSHPIQFPELTSCTERGTIVPVGYDEDDRHTWSCNFQLIVEPGASAISHRASL